MNRPFDSDLESEVRYLLGKMGEAEREAFQERVLDDPLVFDRVADAENQLFDAYARGVLDPLDRHRIEQRLLRSPGQQRKLRAARAFAARTRRKSFRAPAYFAVAAAITLALAIPVLLRFRNPPDTDTRAAAPLEERFTITLPLPRTPGEGENIPQYAIPAGADHIEVRIPVPPTEPVSSLRGELLHGDQTIATFGEGPRVIEDAAGQQFVTLPAGSLTPGTYRVRLLGKDGTTVAWYDFRVEQAGSGP
jgi:hypothetical protein